MDAAVQTLVPKVDTARDKIVEELLPRIAAALTAAAAASVAAREEALAVGHEAAVRGSGAKSVLVGEAVAKHKRHLGKGGKAGPRRRPPRRPRCAPRRTSSSAPHRRTTRGPPRCRTRTCRRRASTPPRPPPPRTPQGVAAADSTQLLDGSGDVAGTGQEDGERREPGQQA